MGIVFDTSQGVYKRLDTCGWVRDDGNEVSIPTWGGTFVDHVATCIFCKHVFPCPPLELESLHCEEWEKATSQEPWICNCQCHTEPDMGHFAPCCEVCPFCHKRVKTGHINRHHVTCRKSWPRPNMLNEVARKAGEKMGSAYERMVLDTMSEAATERAMNYHYGWGTMLQIDKNALKEALEKACIPGAVASWKPPEKEKTMNQFCQWRWYPSEDLHTTSCDQYDAWADYIASCVYCRKVFPTSGAMQVVHCEYWLRAEREYKRTVTESAVNEIVQKRREELAAQVISPVVEDLMNQGILPREYSIEIHNSTTLPRSEWRELPAEFVFPLKEQIEKKEKPKKVPSIWDDPPYCSDCEKNKRLWDELDEMIRKGGWGLSLEPKTFAHFDVVICLDHLQEGKYHQRVGGLHLDDAIRQLLDAIKRKDPKWRVD